MNKKVLLTVFLSFGITYFSLEAFFGLLIEQQQENDAKQTKIILENVQDRFKKFLDLPLSIGIMGADYFSRGKGLQNDYEPFAQELLEINSEILGLSILDSHGKIIRVYPVEKNPGTQGKISQNIGPLQSSLKNKNPFWFSPPFKLYQGQLGFALYIPITQGDSHLGWFAPVIGTELFTQKFSLSEFLSSYELIIKDQETGLKYFATALPPEDSSHIFKSEAQVRGRNLVFESWRKNGMMPLYFPWYWSLLGALVVSLIFVTLLKLILHKNSVRRQLQEISMLLRLSAKEAVNHLIDIQSGNDTKNAISTNNLIEQIDLLQMMTHSKEVLIVEKLSFLSLLEIQLESMAEIIHKKNLKVLYHSGNLSNVFLTANRSLFDNSILLNILIHTFIYSEVGGRIRISPEKVSGRDCVTFHIEKFISDQEMKTIKTDRRLEVAKKALHIYQAKMYLENDQDGMKIKIFFTELK
jgi:hypothetical protein